MSGGAWESQGKACSPQRTSTAPYPRGCGSTSPGLFHPTPGLSCTKPLHTPPAHGPAHTLFAHWRHNCHHLSGTSLLPGAIPIRWPILALKVLHPGDLLHASLMASGGSGIPRRSLTFRHITTTSASIFAAAFLYVCVLSSSDKTPVFTPGSTLNPG